MKIVILGAAGQLGRALAARLPGALMPLTRAQADLTKPLQVRAALMQHRPVVVVNAAGFTQVDRAETEVEEAFEVNGRALFDLAIICRDLGCTLIHFSTDYVFGADVGRATPYTETDLAGPINVYGASKLAGENYLRVRLPRHFIVRTCGVYGVHGPANFVETMLRRADQGLPIRVVDDQVCTPTAADDVAAGVAQLLASDAYGTYHLTNAGSCSWHEFAQAIFALSYRPVRVEPTTSAEYGAAARRPHYSVLSNARWLEAGFTPLRFWRDALADYLAQRALVGGAKR